MTAPTPCRQTNHAPAAAMFLLALAAPTVGCGTSWHALNAHTAAASSPVEISTFHDRFTGLSWVKVTKPDKPLPGGPGWLLGSASVYFRIVMYEPENVAPYFAAEVEYSSEDWLFLDGHVTFLIDANEREEITGPSSAAHRRVLPISGHIEETESIPVSDSLVARLARAHSVEIRADGDQYVVERRFSEETLAAVRAMARYVLR